MRIRYSFSSRRNRRIENIKKQRAKYPAILEDVIRSSDIILEVLDARFPEKTRNYEVEERILKLGKSILYVLNKADLISKNKKNNYETFDGVGVMVMIIILFLGLAYFS